MMVKFELRVLLIVVLIGLSACKTSPSAESSSESVLPSSSVSATSAEASPQSVVNDEGEPVISSADKNAPLVDEVIQQEVKSGEFNLYPMETNGWDEGGWSIITPSEDSRLIYVSASTGNDETAEFYAPRDINDVSLPGNIKPFETIEAALSLTRDGFPDWILLSQGDVWVVTNSLKVKRGRSPFARTVITSYGSSGERPLIKSSASEAIRLWDGVNFIAIKGISLYASHRDPLSQDFVGWGSVPDIIGIRIYKNSDTAGMSILIEDNAINFFSNGMSIDGGGELVDLVVRRNIISNSYSENSHAQGMYAGKSSVLLEENVFYHNGWYKKQVGSGNDKEEGQATIFNHNTYFPKSRDTIFRKNIFIGASSIHNKWTADSKSEDGFDSVQARNIVIENNVYIGGEIGISAGGNTDYNTGHRWANVSITNNIMLSIGRERPTNRTLGWYIDASDWDGGVICGNYLLHNNNSDVTNLKGIELSGHSADVVVKKNTIIGLINQSTAPNAAALLLTGDTFRNIRVEENVIQLVNSKLRPVRANSLDGISFEGNRYYSQANIDQWFKVGSTESTFDEWQIISNEVGAANVEVPFITPARSLETYAASIGESIEQLTISLLSQSKSLWQREYTADSISDHVKDGYGSYTCE